MKVIELQVSFNFKDHRVIGQYKPRCLIANTEFYTKLFK